MENVEYALRRQTEAARDLIAAIHSQGEGDDAELVADAVEGETDLLEAIGAALDEIDECDIIEAGCKAKLDELGKRKSAATARKTRIRAAIEQAIVMAELPTPIKLPAATVSITKRKAQPVIDDESKVPARFFVQPPAPPPEIDKKALAEALAAGSVEGAHLDNGTISLMIRR